MTQYEWNESAETIGSGMIPQIHQHLERLKIAYLFKQRTDHEANPPKAKQLRYGEKIILTKTRLVSKIYEALLEQGYKFIIEFDRDYWELLSLDQQRALVDHELSHCGNDVDGCYIKNHDIEEFRSVVERHGLWKSDIEAFAASLDKQRSLALD